jgi:hypothetical protein
MPEFIKAVTDEYTARCWDLYKLMLMFNQVYTEEYKSNTEVYV